MSGYLGLRCPDKKSDIAACSELCHSVLLQNSEKRILISENTTFPLHTCLCLPQPMRCSRWSLAGRRNYLIISPTVHWLTGVKSSRPSQNSDCGWCPNFLQTDSGLNSQGPQKTISTTDLACRHQRFFSQFWKYFLCRYTQCSSTYCYLSQMI